jgi:hypothetical protein
MTPHDEPRPHRASETGRLADQLAALSDDCYAGPGDIGRPHAEAGMELMAAATLLARIPSAPDRRPPSPSRTANIPARIDELIARLRGLPPAAAELPALLEALAHLRQARARLR